MNKPDCVIRSSAVNEKSEILKPWLKTKVPVYRRGDFLAKATSGKKVIAVVGSHGKTTTSAMLVWALKKEKLFIFLFDWWYVFREFYFTRGVQ